MEWADFERYVEYKVNVTFAEMYIWCCIEQKLSVFMQVPNIL